MIPELATDDLMPMLIEIRNLSSDKYEAIAQYVRDAYREVLPAGKIIASNVSLEDYMEYYAADHCEWVEGYIIKMSPGTLKHNSLIRYLAALLDTYFELIGLGRLVTQPFVMRLPAFPRRCREPDLFVVLNTNLAELRETYMDGPADICIEIVSEESIERDYEDKFKEYEVGGVPEYWILDPLQKESRFYRRDETGHFIRHTEDALGNYTTPALPKLALHVPTLWQENLPGPIAVTEAVKAMLKDAP